MVTFSVYTIQYMFKILHTYDKTDKMHINDFITPKKLEYYFLSFDNRTKLIQLSIITLRGCKTQSHMSFLVFHHAKAIKHNLNLALLQSLH